MTLVPEGLAPFGWSAVGQLAVAVIAVITATWAFARSLGRPVFENAVLAAIVAKRPEIETMIRTQILSRDLDAVENTAKTIERAALLAEGNAKMIEELSSRHDRLDGELRALPVLVQSVDTLTKAVDKLDGRLDAVTTQMGRLGGILEER